VNYPPVFVSAFNVAQRKFHDRVHVLAFLPAESTSARAKVVENGRAVRISYSWPAMFSNEAEIIGVLSNSGLESNQNFMGVLGEWIRIEKNGKFKWKNLFGDGYKHEAVATLMVRTKEVRQKVGFWDSVRIAADTEFFIRLRHVFGKEKIPKIKVPLVLSLFHESSLTRNSETGISVGSMKGLSPTRLEYRDSWKRWHEVSGDNLYMPFPLKSRKFPAPQVMLP
jgi:hypothetical protein